MPVIEIVTGEPDRDRLCPWLACLLLVGLLGCDHTVGRPEGISFSGVVKYAGEKHRAVGTPLMPVEAVDQEVSTVALLNVDVPGEWPGAGGG